MMGEYTDFFEMLEHAKALATSVQKPEISKSIIRELFGTKEQRLNVAKSSETPFVVLLMIALEDDDEEVSKEAVMNPAFSVWDWKQLFIPREVCSTSSFYMGPSTDPELFPIFQCLQPTYYVRWQVFYEMDLEERIAVGGSSYIWTIMKQNLRKMQIDEQKVHGEYDKSEFVLLVGNEYTKEEVAKMKLRLEYIKCWVCEKARS